MLIARPFTNEEVAARLELGCMDPGMIAEACRRLRGLPGSGCPAVLEAVIQFDESLPTILPEMIPAKEEA